MGTTRIVISSNDIAGLDTRGVEGRWSGYIRLLDYF
jgi:hypothetical protein